MTMTETVKPWVYHAPDGTDWALVAQSQGGFLLPPGHPNHSWSLEERRSRRILSAYPIDTVHGGFGGDLIPAEVRALIAKVMEASVLVESFEYLRHTYGYFRNVYYRNGVRVPAADVEIDKTNSLPAEWHAAVVTVRRFFPEHEPREDMIHGVDRVHGGPMKLYGAYPCRYCHKSVQYEPWADALCTISSGPRRGRNGCPDAPLGKHEWSD